MPRSNYQKVRRIGSGSCGFTYLYKVVQPLPKLATDKLVAIKKIDLSKMNSKEREKARGEASVLGSLRYPYIVRHWESYEHDRLLCIVMEYCEFGDLSEHIAQCRNKRNTVPERRVVRWFTQMCCALAYMHKHNILHRDIKPSNVLMACMENADKGNCKIADFGISKILGGANDFADTMVGTPYYLSPEMCQANPYGCPSDIWAAGCVLFELCALRPPFEAQDICQLMDRIVNSRRPEIPSTYSRHLGEAFSDMLQRDTNRRPTAAAIVQRPWMQAEIGRLLAEKSEGQGSGAERVQAATPGGEGKSSEVAMRRSPLAERNEPMQPATPVKNSVQPATPVKNGGIRSARVAWEARPPSAGPVSAAQREAAARPRSARRQSSLGPSGSAVATPVHSARGLLLPR